MEGQVNIAVFGTSIVGQTLAGKLAELGQSVVMGTREVEITLARAENDRYGNPPVREWLRAHPEVKLAAYRDAAAEATLIINATAGQGSLDALGQARAENLSGKVLMDVSNALDFSRGMPPSLFTGSDDSLAEQIQRAFPEAQVVKTLNIVNAAVMVNPAAVNGGDHDMFVAGNDAKAKEKVTGLLKGGFGWKNVIDLGDLTAARAMEMYLPLWLQLMGVNGGPMFNIKVVR